MITVPEVNDEKALEALESAKILKIWNNDDYIKAGSLRDNLKTLETEINRTFDHLIEGAYKHHRALTSEKKRHFEPIEEARRLIKQSMIGWEAEQDRIRNEEQDRIDNENRKKAEDNQIRMAEFAEKSGDSKKAQAIINATLQSMPVILPKNTPKISGHTVRTLWDAEVFDLQALIEAVAQGKVPRTLLIMNANAMREFASSTKGTVEIPGVRF